MPEIEVHRIGMGGPKSVAGQAKQSPAIGGRAKHGVATILEECDRWRRRMLLDLIGDAIPNQSKPMQGLIPGSRGERWRALKKGQPFDGVFEAK